MFNFIVGFALMFSSATSIILGMHEYTMIDIVALGIGAGCVTTGIKHIKDKQNDSRTRKY